MGRGSRKRGLLQSQCLAMRIYLFLCFQRRTDFARSQQHTSEAVNTAQCAISHSAAISLQVCKWNALFLGFGVQEITDKRETKKKNTICLHKYPALTLTLVYARLCRVICSRMVRQMTWNFLFDGGRFFANSPWRSSPPCFPPAPKLLHALDVTWRLSTWGQREHRSHSAVTLFWDLQRRQRARRTEMTTMGGSLGDSKQECHEEGNIMWARLARN